MNGADRHDLILVGTSFAASFFLLEWLRRAKPTARALVLERGAMEPHAAQIAARNLTVRGSERADWASTWRNTTPEKGWVVTLRFGGNSNCWVGMTPRMLPEDLRMQSTFGVGEDWPLSYEELAPYYTEVEEIMGVSGPSGATPAARDKPYPLPPHRMSAPELALLRAFPGSFFAAPSARPTVATGRRPPCCANGVCSLCPIDSKFTVLNAMAHLYRDPRVTLLLGAEARAVEMEAGRAAGVAYVREGRAASARGDLVALAANAIMNPHLLARSGLEHPALGKGILDHVGVDLTLKLRGLKGLQSSTIITGHGYMLYGGPRRKDRAGALIETRGTVRELRDQRGRWTESLGLRVVFEDLRQDANHVATSRDADVPSVVYRGVSPYTQRAIDRVVDDLDPLLDALPVESVTVSEKRMTNMGHLMGTTPMGHDPARSIVDSHLVHHRARNLLVLGAGAFPTISPANPTLTLSALSLRSARHIMGPA